MSVLTAEETGTAITSDKRDVLLTFYRTCWNEMTWRRNAGYRTIILGFGYFGLLLTLVAFNQHLSLPIRISLSLVMAVGTLFGAGYLVSNYRKYMAAAEMTVKIEQYLGAYEPTFLGSLGALMPPDRRNRPQVPLTSDPVCLFSVLAFVSGGIMTAIAILLI